MNNRKISINTLYKQLQINVFVCGGGGENKTFTKVCKKNLNFNIGGEK